jgi:cyclohexadienyl dehydratase
MKAVSTAPLLFALILLCAALQSCGTQHDVPGESLDTLQRIEHSKVIRVGYIEWAPCVSRDPKGNTLQGIYVDMINEVATRLGAKPVWIQTNLQNFGLELDTGKIDFMVGPLFVTIPRAQRVAFTESVAYSGNSAVVKSNSALTAGDLSELNKAGITVAVLQGQAMDELVRAKLPQARILRFAGVDNTAPLVAVTSGQADVGFSNAITAELYSAQHPEVRVIFAGAKGLEMLPLAWATRLGDDRLRLFLNSAIAYLKSTGRIAEFQQRQPLRLEYVSPY